MGENICKPCDQQELNFQNIQIAHTTKQQKKPNDPIEKWAEDLNTVDISPKKTYRWPIGT